MVEGSSLKQNPIEYLDLMEEHPRSLPNPIDRSISSLDYLLNSVTSAGPEDIFDILGLNTNDF